MATNTKKSSSTQSFQKQHASLCTVSPQHRSQRLVDLSASHDGSKPAPSNDYLPGGATYQRLLREIASGNPRREPVPQWLDSWQDGYERSRGEKTGVGAERKG